MTKKYLTDEEKRDALRDIIDELITVMGKLYSITELPTILVSKETKYDAMALMLSKNKKDVEEYLVGAGVLVD